MQAATPPRKTHGGEGLRPASQEAATTLRRAAGSGR